jgi:hypothetical protein
MLSVDWLEADQGELPAGTGASIDFTLTAGTSYAGRPYLLCGTMSGTIPGTTLPGGVAVLPINRDAVTDFIYRNLGLPLFVDFNGALDGGGSGAARLDAPPLPPSWAGRTLHFAFALTTPWDFASNPVTVEIVP